MPENGLARAFSHGRPALIAYLMAGYPDRDACLAALRAVAEAGADLIELGVPYSDALADGPVIQNAATEAHRTAEARGGRFGLAESIALAADFLAEAADAPPVALMTYLNPMLRMGLPAVAEAAAAAGVSGFIVPDLPADDAVAETWIAEARPRGIDTVFLVAPTSTSDRVRLAAETSSGFVYVVSSLGVTGERASLAADLGGLVARVRTAAGELPVAVGFGVSTPEQAAEVAALADGVIVGSAVVKRQADVAELGAFVGELAVAVHGA